MATPTDLRDRNRHPEDYARPDDPNLMRKWTGIGAPANTYEWGRNPVHGNESDPGVPARRPTDEIPRGREATEWVPPRQPQRDPWSLTGASRVRIEEGDSRKPLEGAPVSRIPIVEKRPTPQPQQNPWSFGRPIVISPEEPEVHKPLEGDPVSNHEITEFIPERGPVKDPWKHSPVTVVLSEESKVQKPTEPDPVSNHVIREFNPERGRLKDPWDHVPAHRAVDRNAGRTPEDVPKTT